MILMHVKMKNSEDILAYVERSKSDNRILIITSPISINLDPDRGFYANHWLIFSEDNYVSVPSNEVMFINKASESAIDYYKQFFKKKPEEYSTDSYDEDDLEDMFKSMIESKDAIKH